MKTKFIIVALLAFAAGGTCPSDVNNDGTVGIQDFLMVLGAWGPCPNATVVAMAADTNDGGAMAQLWSDGRLVLLWETGIWHSSGDFPPSPYVGVPVSVSMQRFGNPSCKSGPTNCSDQGFVTLVGAWQVIRQYADGYAEWILFQVCRNAADEFCLNWLDDNSDGEPWIPILPMKVR